MIKPSFQRLWISGFSIFVGMQSLGLATPAMASAPTVRSISLEDRQVFNSLNERFRKEAMQSKVSKTLKLSLLGQERKSAGQFLLQQGRMRLELSGDENSLLVINSKKLYAVTLPAAGLKDAKTQVIEASLQNKNIKTSGLFLLLAKGGFDTVFNVTGVLEKGEKEQTYFLTPKKSNSGLKRAQLQVTSDGKYIKNLRYWDELDNETSYEFSDHKKQTQIAWKLFEYTPPADAEVLSEK
jgi:outer membrane lipoprotein-sorting protein